jgi:hypothetical protein
MLNVIKGLAAKHSRLGPKQIPHQANTEFTCVGEDEI